MRAREDKEVKQVGCQMGEDEAGTKKTRWIIRADRMRKLTGRISTNRMKNEQIWERTDRETGRRSS